VSVITKQDIAAQQCGMTRDLFQPQLIVWNLLLLTSCVILSKHRMKIQQEKSDLDPRVSLRIGIGRGNARPV
jgi:hypothetical protein